MKNTGLHHVSVLSSNAECAYQFYTKILGMKLTLKTVNQDDVAMYHLFFGDEEGRIGTEFTVFEMKGTPLNQFGTNAIERTLFLVQSEEALDFWKARFEKFGVLHYGIEEYNGRIILRFEDEDGQRLGLVYREDVDWEKMKPHVAVDIPVEFAIAGIAGVELRVRYPKATARLLMDTFGFVFAGETAFYGRRVEIYQFNGEIFPHEVHLIEDKDSPIQRLGVGGIHHVAFGVESVNDLQELVEDLNDRNKVHSGIVNREFMASSYFREANYNLFEVATPFLETKVIEADADTFEDIPLFLPDFLENRRTEIEYYFE